MSLHLHVKTRLLITAALLLACAVRGDETPDAKEILKSVRLAQTAENRTLTGVLRTEAKKVPFRLTMKDNAVRWEFTDPPQTLVLRLGESSSQLEEITADGKRKVTAARLDDRVRGSDITYADLAMNFLYWQNATVEGEQTIALTKCWQVLCLPPPKSDSPYSKVRVWIGKENGALCKTEMFNREDKLARSFLVMSAQKTEDGLWLLKSMRILATGARSPSYLEIDPPK
jgi:outer membrane lipoprotein-sorting protein